MLLSSIVNDYATIAETGSLTTEIRNGISCSFADARSTIMLLINEPNNDDGQEIKLNNNLIKTTTGNNSITARALYKNKISCKPSLNVFMLCNEIQNLERAEQATIERLNIIKFSFTCVEK